LLHFPCRNASRAIGMCPQGEWEKVDKGGSWVRAMSPYAHKFLDIRMAGSSSETLELSIEEGFFFHLDCTLFFRSNVSSFLYLAICCFFSFFNPVLLFCRVFLVSCDILNPGSGYAKHRILFKQVFGILLQQCHGNWNHPCNTRGPFSGNVFFLPSFLDL